VSGLLRSGKRYIGVAGAARFFAFIAVTLPIIWALDAYALVGLLGLAAIWMAAIIVGVWVRTPQWAALLVEAGLVACVVGSTLPHTLLLTPALVVTPFVCGAIRGPGAVVGSVALQTCALALTTALLDWRPDEVSGGSIFTWLVAGLGFGLIAAFLRSVRSRDDDNLTPYRDARALITRLLDLSGDLSEGLDAVSISQNVVANAREELPLVGAVVYVRRSDALTPLVESAENAALDTALREQLVEQVWSSQTPAVHGGEIAFPLCTDAGVVAVVTAGLPAAAGPRINVAEVLRSLTAKYRPEALQLDTALLFSAVRAEATAEERRRLAREVHDGVAQDVASLGYLVDDLEEAATTPTQRELFGILRQDVTRIVTELRRSVFSLRNETTAAGSLGESIGALARHVTTVNGIPVHLRLEEGATRLRGEVEAELLRITQEAMNNAVKHAAPENIWVNCTVAAPSAEIVVRDDGPGLGELRHDSHGIRIMHERAKLIGARVSLENGESGGAVMRVVVSRTTTQAEPLQDSVSS